MIVPRRPTRLTALTALVAALTTAGLTLPAEAVIPSSAIANDTVWHDMDGAEILAQGGNVLKVGSTYYWVGSQLVHGDPYKQVNLYKSTDLEHWTFVKAILKQSGDSGDLAVGHWLGRPQLAHNPTTGKYVLVAEVSGVKGNNILFASSDTVEGDYQPVGPSTEVDGVTTGDHSVFVDGSQAYLVYVGDARNADGTIQRNASLKLSPLNSDWTAVAKDGTGKDVVDWTVAPNGGREAPAIIKIGSTYYNFVSGMNGWNATSTSYRTTTNVASGTWSAWKTLATSPASSNSFGTQFEQIIPVTGTSGTSYLFNGDRYSQYYDGSGTTVHGIGRNAWYRLTLDASGVPTLHGDTDIDVNAAAGTLTSNPVANGRFDQSGAGITVPQWTVKGTTGAVKVEDTTTHSSRQLTLWNAAAYSAWAGQDISLPNGTYTLSFRYRSSGGQNSAYFAVKNHGAAETHTDLSAAQSAWTTKTVTFQVTTGTVSIGAWADGPGGKWLNIDDVSIWPAT
ncbi:family 43 glycosylhydrolase [Streptomyces griseofuscus]|uniref:family 43 glycosylhydrolase n=1 Tax=Streptomyces griseofuscus TaxID=146922 RepID=UPI003688E4D2